MLAAERRGIILEKLQTNKRVIVAELSEEFEVSEETIRRDLDRLEKEGVAIKSYGGAILNETNNESAYVFRKKKNPEGKEKIGRIIEKLVHDGEYIMVDASSTAVTLVQAIKNKQNLTVITNSVELLLAQPDTVGWEVISTGGYFKEEYLALVGPVAINTISNFYVDKVLISCKGLDMNRGITDPTELFSQLKQTMIHSAKQKILAADYTKFDQVSFSRICSVEDIDIVVTDRRPSDKWMKYFADHRIQCIYED